MPSAIVELLGLACLTVAAFLLAVPAGWAVGGICLLLVGQSLDGVNLRASIVGVFRRKPRGDES